MREAQFSSRLGRRFAAAIVTAALGALLVVPAGASALVPTTLTTSATPTSAPLPTSLSDTATLAGGVNPTGTITFNLYGPNDATCANPPVFTDTETVSGNGNYTTNPAFVPTAIGVYRWTASYSGDVLNDPATSACNAPNESSNVTKANPTLSTNATSSTFPATITDVATLSNGGGTPTGTITFDAYGPNDPTCAGGSVFNDTEVVNGNGNYTTTPAFAPPFAGTYRWRASYSGDANNNAVATTACNAFGETSFSRLTPTITTNATPTVPLGGSITDTATLAGGNSPTGTLSFAAYDFNDPNCAGAPVFIDTETVAGNGIYTASPSFTPTTAGTYRWRVTYTGNSLNNSVQTACNEPNESSVVTGGPAPPTPTTPTTQGTTATQPDCSSLFKKLKRNRTRLRQAATPLARERIRNRIAKIRLKLFDRGCL